MKVCGWADDGYFAKVPLTTLFGLAFNHWRKQLKDRGSPMKMARAIVGAVKIKGKDGTS